MDKFDRILALHRLLRSHRYPVPLKQIAEHLECGDRQARRLIDVMRDRVQAPLEYDPARRGWHYVEDPGNRFELPGLWLTGEEIQSLSLLLNLLETLGNDLLNNDLSAVHKELATLLKSRGINPSAFTDRIRVLPIAHRHITNKVFNQLSEALLHNKQLHITYSSYNQTKTERELSPQTLVYYRENWYLDAWCHLRNDLRTFSIARIQQATILKKARKAIPKPELQNHFASSYGIFAGIAKHTAKIRFTREIAREIALQQWHPDQQSEWDGQDYILTLPYSDDRELIQDLLRHTPHVYVEAPVKLRKRLQNKLQQGLELQLGKGLGWL